MIGCMRVKRITFAWSCQDFSAVLYILAAASRKPPDFGVARPESSLSISEQCLNPFARCGMIIRSSASLPAVTLFLYKLFTTALVNVCAQYEKLSELSGLEGVSPSNHSVQMVS